MARAKGRKADSGADSATSGPWRNRIAGQGLEDVEQLLAHPLNWRIHPDYQQQALEGVLQEVGLVQQVVVNRTTGHLVDGHLRAQLALRRGQAQLPVLYVELSEEEEQLVLATLDPLAALAATDQAKLNELLAGLATEQDALAALLRDLEEPTAGPGDDAAMAVRVGSLLVDFLVPPFTVLDARQGYWRQRKEMWHQLGVAEAEGKEYMGTAGGINPAIDRGVPMGASAFDPVLAELVCRWFNVPGGSVLDPFAGEATKGVVAGVLGHSYVGVELRPEQVAANEEQWARVAQRVPQAQAVAPVWLQGDSAELSTVLPDSLEADLVFTSPPYYDLEVYTGSDKDGSTLGSYTEFMAWLTGVWASCVEHLREGRFLVVKVGDVRDRQGAYRNFPGDTVWALRGLGLHLYNEAVLVTPVGSLPVRAGHGFRASRKLAKGHQNVLVFWKGDPRTVGDYFPREVACDDSWATEA